MKTDTETPQASSLGLHVQSPPSWAVKILAHLRGLCLYSRTLPGCRIQMSREEIEAMFGLSELKQTRVYQEGKQKGRVEAKLEAIPRLLALGLTVEQIAQALDLDVAQVQQVAQQTPPNQ